MIKKTKEELSTIIDDFHFQIMIIKLCLDSIDALKEIGQDVVDKYNAKNFIYIAHSSLIFRYEIELAKLFMSDCKEMKFSQITSLCCNNTEHFSSSDEEIRNLCGQISDTIKNHKTLKDNLVARRNKALAHSDFDYYYYNRKYIEDYPLDKDETRQVVEALFDFACILQKEIGSRGSNYNYPQQSDDVKHLFGMKTVVDIEIERIENKIKENWKQSKQ